MLHEVSETALITLRSRVIESQKENPVILDPVGSQLYQGLLGQIPQEVQQRIIQVKASPVLTGYIARRARKYDELCREFLTHHADGLVLNLGCGFDTRFWRLGLQEANYMELDLPEVLELKKKILGDQMNYSFIEGSVLDTEWISAVRSTRAEKVIILAEGLFMYFPEDKSISTIRNIADAFTNSRLVMEVVHSSYTRGFRKKLVQKKMRKGAGSGAGNYYRYGIQNTSELERYHPRIRIRGEWSYLEERDLKPAALRIFRHFRTFTRNQYTVIADIE